MPTWRQGIAVGEWRQVAGTALASAPIAVKTFPSLSVVGPEAKVIAWNGFAVDTRDSSIYSAASGGHMDYAGNEVNRIRLSDNAPAWTEPRASTPVAQIIANTTHYADGRPTSRHSYYGTVVNEVRNRAMVLSGARWGDGYSPGGVLDGFNLASNDWDSARTYPDGPIADFGAYNGWTVVDHKSSGDVYAFANFSVLRWSNATNTWSRRLAGTAIYGQYAASAMDTKRNRVLVVGGNANDHGLYDLGVNTVQSISLVGPNAGSLSGDGNAMVYDPILDAFLVRKGDAGGTVYRINAQTFNVDTLPITGGATISSTSNGVWARFLYVPKLKGIVYFPTYGGNLWFLRTS
jgi:hypothetical protein